MNDNLLFYFIAGMIGGLAVIVIRKAMRQRRLERLPKPKFYGMDTGNPLHTGGNYSSLDPSYQKLAALLQAEADVYKARMNLIYATEHLERLRKESQP